MRGKTISYYMHVNIYSLQNRMVHETVYLRTDHSVFVRLFHYDDTPDTLYISHISVANKYRRRNYANKALELLIEGEAKQRKMKQINASVYSGSWVQQWLQRKGFTANFVSEKSNDVLVTMIKTL